MPITSSNPTYDNPQTQAPQSVQYAPYSRQFEDDTIDFYELWITLWNKKGLVIAVTVIAALGSVVHALQQPIIYKAEALLLPPKAKYVQSLNFRINQGVDVEGKLGRDQGMSSKPTEALLAAAAGLDYTVPFSGQMGALHAGEVASAFIKSVSKEREGAPVFDINGVATTVEHWVKLLRQAQPEVRVHVEGAALPFPGDLSDKPLREFLGDYGTIDLEFGIRETFSAFKDLLARGIISANNLS